MGVGFDGSSEQKRGYFKESIRFRVRPTLVPKCPPMSPLPRF